MNPIDLTGGVTYDNGVFSVRGDGEDIEGTADGFYFVHQTLSGDGQIIARVASLQGADPAAEAGIMIRENLAAGAKHAFLRVDASTKVVFRRRLATDAYSIDNAYSGTNCLWLRLMRMGNTLIGHCSTDGTNWNYVWFSTVNMSNQVQAGLAVTAHHQDWLAAATFDNVSIGGLSPLPGTWSNPVICLGGEAPSPAAFEAWGGFKMLLCGNAGDWLKVYASQNLSTWASLGTATNTYAVVPFLDSQALTNRMRFYRAQRTGP